MSIGEDKKKAEIQGCQTQHPKYHYRLVRLLFFRAGKAQRKAGHGKRPGTESWELIDLALSSYSYKKIKGGDEAEVFGTQLAAEVWRGLLAGTGDAAAGGTVDIAPVSDTQRRGLALLDLKAGKLGIWLQAGQALRQPHPALMLK